MSINALTPGRRSRTRDSVDAIRHLFLDADREADRVLAAIGDRPDLPAPSYVLRSSKGRAHFLWRVEGMSVERAEAIQKYLARELGTDTAATSAAQMTRQPGFFNHKYTPPQLVEVVHRDEQATYGRHNFPEDPKAVGRPAPVSVREPQRGGMPHYRASSPLPSVDTSGNSGTGW